MRLAVAALALVVPVAAALAGCTGPSEEPSPRDRAWDWLLGQRGEDGRWPVAFVPHVVEAAVASGRDPASWPPDAPLVGQLEWPAEGAPYMGSLRPLHAWALLPGDGGRGPDVAARLLAGFDGRQFGQPALLNDDAYALLALAAVDPAEAAARSASLAQNQSASGGWSWSPDGSPETDMTGIVLLALSEAGAAGFDREAARGFLDSTHAAGGGHAMLPGGEPNCDSTVWAERGYAALGEEGAGGNLGNLAFLASLQREDGSVAYQPGGAGNALCTVEAVPLLPA